MMRPGEKSERDIFAIGGLVLLAILFVALLTFSNRVFRGVSVDLTEERLFTLSAGTWMVLAEIDEPITFRFFFSDLLDEKIPTYGVHADRVRELLERYADLSGGLIEIESYDPEPFSEIEDLAVAYRLQGIPVTQSGDRAYFGLVGTNSTDDEEIIPFFQPERERFLEYDLTRLVANLVDPEPKVVGILSTLPLLGSITPGVGPTERPWMVYRQIQDRFTVRRVSIEAREIPEDVDILVVVHPKALTDETIYAIDQFVLAGGPTIVFVDPHSEADRMGAGFGLSGMTASAVPRLLEAWGVEVPSDSVVADREAAMRITVGSGANLEIVDHVAWLALTRRNFNPDSVVTADLSRMNLASSGEIIARPGATTEMVPLILSSPEAMRIDAEEVRTTPDFKRLSAEFESIDTNFVLAATIRGNVSSAFADGPPPSKYKPRDIPHLASSAGPANIIVVADVDLLEDRFWVQLQDFYGRTVATPISDNANFVLNAIDYLSGREALIGLRSRGRASRPFDLVREFENEAEVRFRATEQRHQGKLSELEAKLTELRRGDAPSGEVILTAEQRLAFERLQSDILETRKSLREVQHALRADIDRLDGWLRIVNIGLVPTVISIVAIGVAVWRRNRLGRRHVVH